MSLCHILKTEYHAFHAVKSGVKTFEFRKDDRPFEVGDTLILREYMPDTRADTWKETGEIVKCRVTYLARGKFGIPAGFCAMSIERMKE